MLKFFRRIRHKLLDEGNLKRYLVYALGEIFLVMIGILLAIQVNNWNQGQKNNKSKSVYLNSLYSDLKEQSLMLDERINHENRNVESTQKAIDLIDNNLYKQNIDSLRRLMLRSMGTRTFSTSDATYDDLKSTGNLQLISDNELKSKIITLYNWVYEEDKIYSKNNPIVEEFYGNYIRNNKPGFYHDKLGQIKSSKLDNLEILYELRFKLSSRRLFARGHANRMKRIKEEIDALMKELENTL